MVSGPGGIRALGSTAREKLERDGAWRFLGKSLRYPFRPLMVPQAARALAARADRAAGIPELVEVALGFKYGGIMINPWQIRGEIIPFLELVGSRPPRAVLEIGTANGGTFFLLARVADPEAILVTIDLPLGDFGGGYPRWRAPLYRRFASRRQRAVPMLADSHDPATFVGVHSLLEDRKLDLLFIDGDHSYEGVRRDYELYGPLVAPGGVVAFHDIVPGEPSYVGGVPRFWSEIKQTARSRELVADWDYGSCGIGVLFPDEPPEVTPSEDGARGSP
jgi:predicted O-methyltransferase YrrM